MSGGNKGGGGAPRAQPKPTPTETYERAPTLITMQPAIPGTVDILSNQLSRGFGADVPGGEVASYLNDMYRPMEIYSFREPISATKSEFDANRHLDISTGNPVLDKLLMGK